MAAPDYLPSVFVAFQSLVLFFFQFSMPFPMASGKFMSMLCPNNLEHRTKYIGILMSEELRCNVF